MNIVKKYNILNIRTIYLMMGSKCNFKCRHCIQGDGEVGVSKDISQDVLDYLSYLADIRPADYRKITIMFWGGEPLIYWEVVKKIISYFGGKFNYAMVSNGSLLTQEKVDYINQHNITFSLSYDGEDTANVRGINVLKDKDKLELFKQINRKSICSVTSAYNYDYQKLYNHIDNLLGNINVNIEQFRITWDMPKDLYNINLINYKEKLHKLAIQAKEDILNMNFSRPVSFFFNYLQSLCYTNKMYQLHCGQMYNKLNIDLQGNIYSCHNLCKPIGSIKDDRVTLINRQDKWVEDNTPSKCKDCKYFQLCDGGCPNELIGSDGERISCKINKIVFQEVLWLANELENSFLDVDLE